MKKFIKYGLLILTVVLLLLLVWGVGIEPRLMDVKEEVADVPNLPAACQGKRVALIADLQVGMWLDNTDTIRRIVNRIVEERPAAALIAGDFVYHPTEDEPDDTEREDFLEFREEIDEVTNLLRPLAQAGIPTYAVLGNHDYGMPTVKYAKNELLARNLQAALQSAGIRVLDNEAVSLVSDAKNDGGQAGDSALYLVGVGSHVANTDKPQVALAQVPDGAPRIAFMHNPDSFILFPQGSAPLALAGHTHGGQLRVPFTPNWSWMALLSDEKIYADGWIDGYGQPGNRLYVNRGIGFSVVPVRINCRPELTFFTLR
ncbi:MAG: metallophosphoesterase [Pyrinomonadaceae bacterium MAG19_C2-C3]|nr:metallophosphoesterase [Pyrinomonadaceae bacterium MAG19_C2-C3]